jgi:hypothetical protein
MANTHPMAIVAIAAAIAPITASLSGRRSAIPRRTIAAGTKMRPPLSQPERDAIRVAQRNVKANVSFAPKTGPYVDDKGSPSLVTVARSNFSRSLIKAQIKDDNHSSRPSSVIAT